MNRRALITTLALLWIAFFPLPALAQDVTAEVKTWSGQSWRLSQPSLEVFYSIVSKSREGGADAGSEVGKATNFTNLTLGGLSRESTDPSVATLSRLFGENAPDTIQGHRQAQQITAYRGGVVTQIPLGSISTITLVGRS